ncbi:MAG: Acetyl-coenzyme A carboxylase carboxyl transferase subunit beta [Chlamydiia bacterium]|nr:Acetyl-coenzyme A carboxylase carboxyl transferase subunit beta [Chlamydiia bacterium]
MGIIRLFTRQKPKIKVKSSKRDGFSGWVKCGGCSEIIHASELKENFNCCSKCNYHYRLGVDQRIELIADEGTFEELFTDLKPGDPLEFTDSEKYTDRLERAQEKSGRDEAVKVGKCQVNGHLALLGVFDFSFMGGSMGSVVGERLTRLIEYGAKSLRPVIIVSASGGARMQESIFSLMQMAKTSCALARLGDKKVPFISVLTNPTMGGVTASFASLGDVNIAEPGALIGFAGPRVIEQTIGRKLPEGYQKAEFLLKNGMLDAVVPRPELKDRIAFFIHFLMGGRELPVNNEPRDMGSKNQPIDVPGKLKRLISAATWGGKKEP